MKKILLTVILFCSGIVCFAQSSLISYDDLSYLLHNNINKADTFFVSKGYTLVKKDIKKNTRKYTLAIQGGTFNNVNLRTDGKRLFLDIETNEIQQYNLIYNSIADYLNKASSTVDVQAFTVKDLGSIYIMVTDAVPYNPMRRNYDIQIISDKSITAYN
jgi:predicted house-cleaning NTP pyrophosphatase (Maf/HAM1 superfamily)